MVALGNGVPTFVSGDFSISAIGAGVLWKTRPGLSYSTVSHQYLVTWPQINDGEIHGRLIGDTGTLLGSDLSITTDSSSHDRSAVAYNPTTDRFLVGYQGSALTYNFIEARWVQAGTGAGPIGLAMRVLNGVVSGTSLYGGDVAYNSATGKSVQVFYLQPGAGDSSAAGIYAQRYTASGSFDGSAFAVSTSYGGGDALRRMAYNPVSNTFALVTYAGGAEDAVLELNQDGTLNSGGLTVSLGGAGVFNPAIAANPTQAQWILVTDNGNSSMWYEFFTTSSREPTVGSVAKSSPGNGASGVSVPVTLTWGVATGATAYQVLHRHDERHLRQFLGLHRNGDNGQCVWARSGHPLLLAGAGRRERVLGGRRLRHLVEFHHAGRTVVRQVDADERDGQSHLQRAGDMGDGRHDPRV